MSKLVTDNQGRETARLARGVVGLSRSVFQEALTDGRMTKFLQTLVPSEVVYLDWVAGHLTPEFASKKVVNPGAVNLWLAECQKLGNPYPTGNRVYREIKENDLLKTSLSLGHLQWYEQNPDEIPTDFKGKLIYAWADVVRCAAGFLRVPCLYCGGSQPFVNWYWLDCRWDGDEPAGLREET